MIVIKGDNVSSAWRGVTGVEGNALERGGGGGGAWRGGGFVRRRSGLSEGQW